MGLYLKKKQPKPLEYNFCKYGNCTKMCWCVLLNRFREAHRTERHLPPRTPERSQPAGDFFSPALLKPPHRSRSDDVRETQLQMEC